MAVFVDTGTYLKYGSKPPGQSRGILWPVLVHRVLYPEVQRPEMNLFQKVVMRLIRAKIHDAEDISTLTGLDINLIKLILGQLMGRSWINGEATALTDSGLKAIHYEDDQSEQMASGYLFQDGATGKLWPRIDNRLAVEASANPGEKFPEFALNRNTGKLLKPFKPRLKQANYALPTARDALHAWQDYRSDYYAARQLTTSGQLPKQVQLSGLTYQSEKPERAWVLVWITASHNSKLWSIKDPFDIRDEAWWLTDSLPQLLESDRNLARNLGGLIEQPEPDNQTVSEWLSSLQDQANLQVMLEYPWAKSDPDIEKALAVLLKRREMLESGQTHNNDLEAAITEVQKLLEILMQWLIKSFPGERGSLPRLGKNDWKLNATLLGTLKLPAFTENVTSSLSRQNLHGVIKSLTSPSSSLKALVFAAALDTVGNDNHPFKSLSNQQLQLHKLLELADLRNQTSHGNSRHTGKQYKKITVEIAQTNIEYALQFTEHFKEWINGEK